MKRPAAPLRRPSLPRAVRRPRARGAGRAGPASRPDARPPGAAATEGLALRRGIRSRADALPGRRSGSGPPARAFWAVWDRASGRLHERTRLGPGAVTLSRGRGLRRAARSPDRARARGDPGHRDGLRRAPAAMPGRASRAAFARPRNGEHRRRRAPASRPGRWSMTPPPTTSATRTGAGARASGRADDGTRPWHGTWSRGSTTRRAAASARSGWTAQPPRGSRRSDFAADLRAVGELRFEPEATREHAENLLVLRSRYRQPFGTFSGQLGRPRARRGLRRDGGPRRLVVSRASQRFIAARPAHQHLEPELEALVPVAIARGERRRPGQPRWETAPAAARRSSRASNR